MLRRFVLKTFKPLSKLMNKIHYSPSHRLFKLEQYHDLMARILPGDIVISTMKGELTNVFIPGFWSHASLYIGDKVIEATAEWVRYTEMMDFCFSKDYIIVLRPIGLSSIQYEVAVDLAMMCVGKAYDYYFEPGIDAFYCAELITRAYDKMINFTLRKTWGVDTATPQDFVDSNKFQVIYNSKY